MAGLGSNYLPQEGVLGDMVEALEESRERIGGTYDEIVMEESTRRAYGAAPCHAAYSCHGHRGMHKAAE